MKISLASFGLCIPCERTINQSNYPSNAPIAGQQEPNWPDSEWADEPRGNQLLFTTNTRERS